MSHDPRQFTLAVIVAGISYEPARNFTINCGCGPVPETEFYRIQREMILVIIEFARAIAAANRDEIEEGSCLGIDSS
jgi:hypothetical protein